MRYILYIFMVLVVAACNSKITPTEPKIYDGTILNVDYYFEQYFIDGIGYLRLHCDVSVFCGDHNIYNESGPWQIQPSLYYDDNFMDFVYPDDTWPDWDQANSLVIYHLHHDDFQEPHNFTPGDPNWLLKIKSGEISWDGSIKPVDTRIIQLVIPEF